MTTQSSSKLYIILIVLTGLVGGYVFYSQWIQPSEAAVPAPPIGNTRDGLSEFKDMKINFSILNDATYKGLITSGESPVNPGVTGKKDLFAP